MSPIQVLWDYNKIVAVCYMIHLFILFISYGIAFHQKTVESLRWFGYVLLLFVIVYMNTILSIIGKLNEG